MKNEKLKTVTVKGIAEVGLFLALLIICSFVWIPFGAVPITLQTVGVIMSVCLLGVKKGLLVTACYLVLGAVGLPIFSGFSGGIGVLLSPTGGFLIGFVPMSLVIGLLTLKWGRGFKSVTVSSAVGTLVLYLVGVVFYANLHLDGISGAYLSATLTCVVPFLLPDALKIVLSALLVTRLKRFIA